MDVSAAGVRCHARCEDLVELALASERLLFPPGPERVTDPSETAKMLLVLRDGGWSGPEPTTALSLEPLVDEAAWRAYADLRIEVEHGFGVEAPEALRMVETLRCRATDDGLQMYFARAGTDRVGAIGYLPVEAAHVRGARLQEVDIFPGHRGRGHGNALLGAVTRMLRHAGAGAIVVGADEDDWPLEWYRRHGFRDMARVPLTR